MLVVCPEWAAAYEDFLHLSRRKVMLPRVHGLHVQLGKYPMPAPRWDSWVFYIYVWPPGLRSLLTLPECRLSGVTRSVETVKEPPATGRGASLLSSGIEPNPNPRGLPLPLGVTRRGFLPMWPPTRGGTSGP